MVLWLINGMGWGDTMADLSVQVEFHDPSNPFFATPGSPGREAFGGAISVST